MPIISIEDFNFIKIRCICQEDNNGQKIHLQQWQCQTKNDDKSRIWECEKSKMILSMAWWVKTNGQGSYHSIQPDLQAVLLAKDSPGMGLDDKRWMKIIMQSIVTVLGVTCERKANHEMNRTEKRQWQPDTMINQHQGHIDTTSSQWHHHMMTTWWHN